MSARYVEAVWHLPLPGAMPHARPEAQRLLLVAMAWRARDDGIADWSLAEYAGMTGIKERAARYALSALAGQGLLVLEGSRLGGRLDDERGRPTRWRLGFEAWTSESTRHSSAAFNPAQNDVQPGTERPPTRHSSAPPQDTKTRSASKTRSGPGPSPLRQRAKAVLDPWWARQTVKPATPYIGALKVCERALQGGMPDADLAAALDEVPAISGGALDFWRARRGNGQSDARPGLSLEQHEAINDYGRRVDAARAARKRGRR